MRSVDALVFGLLFGVNEKLLTQYKAVVSRVGLRVRA